MQARHLILLLYDSVTNSVFESQVLKPYHALVRSGRFSTMTIISYEKQDFIKAKDTHRIMHLLNTHYPEVTCHFLQRPFFWGLFSLKKPLQKLHALLQQQPPHTLIARGPISGYIARHAKAATTQELIIQARGLLYEEYRMTTAQAPWYLKPLHAYRARQFKKLEQAAYTSTSTAGFTVESVSPALRDYLQHTYGLTASVTLATHDTPPMLTTEQRTVYRQQYRQQLKIGVDAPVYAYNGSFKQWQYADGTFTYFKQQYAHNSSCLLLCITQDIQEARQYTAQHNLPEHAVMLISVAHHYVIPLLCAADYGLLFREPHIVNWTSRPTKLLEYQAAGITIIHNNTINILQNNPTSIYAQCLND